MHIALDKVLGWTPKLSDGYICIIDNGTMAMVFQMTKFICSMIQIWICVSSRSQDNLCWLEDEHRLWHIPCYWKYFIYTFTNKEHCLFQKKALLKIVEICPCHKIFYPKKLILYIYTNIIIYKLYYLNLLRESLLSTRMKKKYWSPVTNDRLRYFLWAVFGLYLFPLCYPWAERQYVHFCVFWLRYFCFIQHNKYMVFNFCTLRGYLSK